ncbi:MAG: hypothetical protein CVV24_06750 [Ignavibacteriae bacterium HGW-Ignavibacteriae-3]|nr:MAG: hypothetical protein CVV24_06750 [Ignavibacteriae bacterium HGW-Ignavibacteriae-3]
MTQLRQILKNKNIVRFVITALGIVIALLFTGLNQSLSKSVSNAFLFLGGENKPDSNIVIIKINQSDIEKLGGWPLRRSYYALLVNKLTKLHVSKIGIEVLLSSNAASQGVYNELLAEELKKSGKVVLSSILGDGGSGRDSIIYSQPRIENQELQSGHLNYLSRDGIYIPAEIRSRDKSEKAFILNISGKLLSDPYLKVNFYTSWKNFQNYSLIEFLRLFEERDSHITSLKNKFILIGVSDPSIAKTIRTFYDEELPGVGLHAIALDNILTNRQLNYKSANIITVILILFLFVGTQIRSRLPYYYILGISLISYIVIAFILFSFFHVEVNHSFLILPFFFIGGLELFYMITENKKQLNESYNETEILRNTLSSKEGQLAKLQYEFELSHETVRLELDRKIILLKEEISLLKNIQQANEEIVSSASLTEVNNFQGIVYKSRVMESLVEMIHKIAPHDVTVLIQGESGSGKELVAHAIHYLSRRKGRNFIAVNCAALTESILESELFGHVKGAFTNALADKKGRFEIADGGTIFLDEIGETSENFQAKLLRVIQFGDFDKVGSSKTQHVDVRVVAATNKKLDELVQKKQFREDLYYRLNVLKLELPPLRDRRDDIEVLVRHFLDLEDKEVKISRAVMESLNQNVWKGNVRELESVIKRAVILAKSEKRNIIKLNDISEDYRAYDKANLETFILDSIRAKEFSHSSINETAKELGNLNRTVVSEHLRGIFFRTYVNNKYNFDKTADEIAGSENEKMLERVKSKCVTYVANIEKDLRHIENKSFEDIKIAFTSKYRNLPSKYHNYLDEVIKHLCNKSAENEVSGI